MVSAVNPICCDLSYDHKYATEDCDATCAAPPNRPPPTTCRDLNNMNNIDYTLTVNVVNINSSEPVTGASVTVTSVDIPELLIVETR